MGKSFSLEPEKVKRINTKFRRILTEFPVLESLEILQTLRRYEPLSMRGQPSVVWDQAKGFQVYDKYGNMWLDWSCGVLITNVGHGRPEIKEAIINTTQHGLLASYCFSSEVRAKLVQKLIEMAPPGIDKVLLLTTGSETTENALKLARAYGQKIGGREKHKIISFERAFHGRTVGAQMMGGIPSLKKWIVNLDPGMIQVPFPDGFRCPDRSFELFLRNIKQQRVKPKEVAGVISETYQGGGASFAPKEYMQNLRRWCNQNKILLILDEVQSGFGRTGKYFAFEHYNIVPDIICCGKGISSSLPLSAVLGSSEVMDSFPVGSMTSTHGGNPVCAAAALANLEVLEKENLVENAARVGKVMIEGLKKLRDEYKEVIGAVHGKGLVAGLHIVKPNSIEPDGEMAFNIVEHCVKKGLLLFSPVGPGGATVKIAPALCITEEAIKEGLEVLGEVFEELS